MKDNPSNEFNYDEALLYTPGKGRNTWSIYFLGKTDKEEIVGFIFRLNISSLPFGFRYIKMYDTVLAITMHDEKYLFGRDFGEIKKKNQLRYDTLFFEGNSSRLQGGYDLLDLTSYVSNGSVDVAMDFLDKYRMVGLLKTETFEDCREKVVYHTVAGNMDCQGMVTVNEVDHNVKGTAWIEKKYAEFPKGRIKPTNTKRLKINFVPNNIEKRLSYVSLSYMLTGEEKTWFTVIEPEGRYFTQETNSDIWEKSSIWVSPDTGIRYPLPININLSDADFEISIFSYQNNQEVHSSGSKKTGEYVGIGHFVGKYEGLEIKGLCSIEISGC